MLEPTEGGEEDEIGGGGAKSPFSGVLGQDEDVSMERSELKL